MNQKDLLFQEAYELFKKGQHSDAYTRFEQICKNFENPGEALWYMGIISLQTEKYEQAIRHLHDALMHEPGNANYMSELGVAYFHIKEGEKSLEYMDLALKIDPTNPYRYSSRAYIRASLGMHAEAIADYEMAIKLDPEDSVAYNNLGLLQEQAGWKEQASMSFEQADALESLQKAIEQDPEQNPIAEVSLPEEEEKTEAKSGGIWQIMGSIFTNAQTRSEFFDFVKRGFKKG